jgi:adenylate cyclase
MKPKARLVRNELVFTVMGWTVLSYFYFFFAFWGQIDLFKSGLIKDYMGGGAAHVEIISQGLLFGSFLALINYLTEKTALRTRSFGQIILIKSVLYLAALALVLVMVYVLFVVFVVVPKETLRQLWFGLPARFYVSFGLYLTLAILAINFLLEVRRKFGPGNLLALMVGRYHHPQVENRVFLFLDLKSSTTIAEQLGHIRYSRFIRSCFHDLTDLVVRYDAQIYQYVGDEVVLSWQANGSVRDDCLQIFFAFGERLRQRRADYEARFGVAPVFRGGMDMGNVTAAEVGDIKREIAYHGDVLNTAARLQELCKTYGEDLLISGRVNAALGPNPHFVARLQGEVALRGKTQPIGVYSIALSEPSAA